MERLGAVDSALLGLFLSYRRNASGPSNCPARRTEAKPAAVRPIHGAPGSERRQPAHPAAAAPWQAAPCWPPHCAPPAGTAFSSAASGGGASHAAPDPREDAAAECLYPCAPAQPAAGAAAAACATVPACPDAWEGSDAGCSALVPATGTCLETEGGPRCALPRCVCRPALLAACCPTWNPYVAQRPFIRLWPQLHCGNTSEQYRLVAAGGLVAAQRASWLSSRLMCPVAQADGRCPPPVCDGGGANAGLP